MNSMKKKIALNFVATLTKKSEKLYYSLLLKKEAENVSRNTKRKNSISHGQITQFNVVSYYILIYS